MVLTPSESMEFGYEVVCKPLVYQVDILYDSSGLMIHRVVVTQRLVWRIEEWYDSSPGVTHVYWGDSHIVE